MSEARTSQLICAAISKIGGRVFRNHRGKHQTVDGRWVETGLFKGASDLIGFMPVKITPDMVGATIGVFVSIEVKEGRNVVTAEQKTWLDIVNSFGGIGFVAWNVDGALSFLQQRAARPLRDDEISASES